MRRRSGALIGYATRVALCKLGGCAPTLGPRDYRAPLSCRTRAVARRLPVAARDVTGVASSLCARCRVSRLSGNGTYRSLLCDLADDQQRVPANSTAEAARQPS